jgi:hypothetical protein
VYATVSRAKASKQPMVRSLNLEVANSPWEDQEDYFSDAGYYRKINVRAVVLYWSQPQGLGFRKGFHFF